MIDWEDLAIGGFIFLVMGVAIVGFFLLVAWSRTSSVPIAYRLSDGRVVKCRFNDSEPCGRTLSLCEDGQTYSCQVNVTAGVKQ